MEDKINKIKSIKVLGNKIDLTTNKKPFEAVYCIDENEWNGKLSLQLRLKDIKSDS